MENLPMPKKVRMEVPLGSHTPFPVEYDDDGPYIGYDVLDIPEGEVLQEVEEDGTSETSDSSGSSSSSDDAEIHDESASGGEGTEDEPENGDGAEPDETA
jgi:hypothetical protein